MHIFQTMVMIMMLFVALYEILTNPDLQIEEGQFSNVTSDISTETAYSTGTLNSNAEQIFDAELANIDPSLIMTDEEFQAINDQIDQIVPEDHSDEDLDFLDPADFAAY